MGQRLFTFTSRRYLGTMRTAMDIYSAPMQSTLLIHPSRLLVIRLDPTTQFTRGLCDCLQKLASIVLGLGPARNVRGASSLLFPACRLIGDRHIISASFERLFLWLKGD